MFARAQEAQFLFASDDARVAVFQDGQHEKMDIGEGLVEAAACCADDANPFSIVVAGVV